MGSMEIVLVTIPPYHLSASLFNVASHVPIAGIQHFIGVELGEPPFQPVRLLHCRGIQRPDGGFVVIGVKCTLALYLIVSNRRLSGACGRNPKQDDLVVLCKSPVARVAS